MKLQKLLSLTRKAVDEFSLIEDGDKIAVGVSGGKDSLTMLYALHGLMRFYPHPFSIEVITVDLGHPGFHVEKIKELCDSLGLPFTVVKTDIAQIIFDERKESNPCSLCAKMRKGALNEEAKKLGCNKVAYAHHKDDVVETMLLSLIFEGRFHTFSPKTYLDRMDLTVIRPLLYVEGYTKRQYAKELLRDLTKEHPGTKERMFTAILNSNINGWDKRIPK